MRDPDDTIPCPPPSFRVGVDLALGSDDTVVTVFDDQGHVVSSRPLEEVEAEECD
jgi:hypothetical protein